MGSQRQSSLEMSQRNGQGQIPTGDLIVAVNSLGKPVLERVRDVLGTMRYHVSIFMKKVIVLHQSADAKDPEFGQLHSVSVRIRSVSYSLES